MSTQVGTSSGLGTADATTGSRHRSGFGRSQPDRYKVRFPDRESLMASQAAELSLVDVVVSNERRNFISVGASESVSLQFAEPALEDHLAAFQSNFGAEIVPDYQYDLELQPDLHPLPVGPEDPDAPTLDDVLTLIHASDAWERGRGDGISIAVVDTGVNGLRPEFPAAKRRGQWAPLGEDPWVDYLGHGTMCACIATATRAEGGEFDGVAPDAGLISCRTHFYDSELATLYDYLGDLVEEEGMRLVATNSFGIKSGTPPPGDQNADFIPALDDAIARGVIVFFSAGNYHDLAGGSPDRCDPTSIWTYKCREDVLTVAGAKPDETMWFYSSRGPGQYAGESGMRDKPDVTAPTPPNGRVLYGDGPRSLPDGWGTSGACPQAAGLGALLLSANGSLGRQEVFDAIRDSAKPLGHGATCEGTGLIDCRAALARV
jgi:serine protease AprX